MPSVSAIRTSSATIQPESLHDSQTARCLVSIVQVLPSSTTDLLRNTQFVAPPARKRAAVLFLPTPALRDLLHRRPRAPLLPAAHAPIASAGATVAGWAIFLPLVQRALSTAHDFCGLRL